MGPAGGVWGGVLLQRLRRTATGNINEHAHISKIKKNQKFIIHKSKFKIQNSKFNESLLTH
jgi:hypothetical protein